MEIGTKYRSRWETSQLGYAEKLRTSKYKTWWLHLIIEKYRPTIP